MGAYKKQHYSRADSDWRVPKAAQSRNISGFIFFQNKADLERKIFVLPQSYEDSIVHVRRGMPLFLFNSSNRCLYGVYEATSDGGYNLDSNAHNYEGPKSARYFNRLSKYRAQVRVRTKVNKPPLSEEAYRSVLDYDGHRFKLELTGHQVNQLIHLFDASERVLKARSRVNLRPSAVLSRDPDSPGAVYKSDSDCYSDCSSKEINSCEDDWSDGAVNVKYCQGDEEEGILCERLDQIFLDESHCNVNGRCPVPTLAECQSDLYEEQTTWKDSLQKNVHSSVSEIQNTMMLRLMDSDPAVNSVPIGIEQTLNIDHQENSHPMSLMASQVQFQNMVFIPVQTLHCQQRGNTMLHGQSQRSKWGCRNSRKQGWNQDRVQRPKDCRFMKQRMVLENDHPAALPQQNLQFLLQVCPPQRPGEMQEQTFMSPVFLPTNAEGLAFTQTNSGGRVNENGRVFDVCNDVQVYQDGPQHIFQHCPIMFIPSIVQRPPPFRNPGYVEALHYDVLNFAKFTRPPADIQHHVEAAIDCVRKGVKAVWPDADVEVFGSFATGLCLQHSDVDLAVIDAPRIPSSESLSIAQASASLIRELAAALRTYDWCESINPLDTASMPVLKCLCRPFSKAESTHIAASVAVDITIGGMRNGYISWNADGRDLDLTNQLPQQGKLSKRHTGGAAREYVLQKIKELPALAPLVLLLKSYLHHRDLSNVYSGGLGSFSLTLLVAFFLERVSPMHVDASVADGSSSESVSSPLSCSSEFSDDSDTPSSSSSFGVSSSSGENNAQSLGERYVRRAADALQSVLCAWNNGGSPLLGTLLLGFLTTFGCHLDLSCEKLVLKGVDGNPGGIYKRDDRHVALWIDDPLRPGVNIGAGSYGMVHVQAAFKEMLEVITDGRYTASVQCHDKDCQDIAAISQLPYLSRLSA